MAAERLPAIAILLATHQGQEFLSGQLDSFERQTLGSWRVWASDDASSDGTRDMLERYGRRWGTERLTVVNGPGRGVDENFRALIALVGREADAFAYSDQDDVWVPDKLERAARWLKTIPATRPALYCGRTRLIDGHGRQIGLSPLFRRPPSFANALVQNLGGGNTMVFNRAAHELLRVALPASNDVVIYDWWTYLLVSGAGGSVYYDPEPSVLYRQHGHNVVGANTRMRDRVSGVTHMLKGRLRAWNDRHVQALERVGHLLTPENRERLERFKTARTSSFVPRLVGLKRAGIYRQTAAGNAGIVVAAVLNRL